ncbi:MAG: class I SAM-dependent methyltransferase [Ruminococcus sp.]|nr:class I SAM-dependent methyltransferase [Ruminococcus sp.]MCM1153919.1 class I SAM-dependent methyltransferase [Roseburia sp.]
MICPICADMGKKIFQGKIMHKYTISYYQCPVCGFVYTEEPYWLEEAYTDSITNIDTGMMQRTIDNVLTANAIVHNFFDTKASFLDYGGGYGIFTRMMRDLGYNWLWYDKYSDNYAARGFEYKRQEKIELITAFELFEHFDRPIEEITHLFTISRSVLFSTLIYDQDFAYKDFEKWWYYVPETGQHIGFYSQRTLEYIARKFHVFYYKISDGMHLFSEHKINSVQFNILIKSKVFKLIQYLGYFARRQHGLAEQDMKTILSKYEEKS